MRGLSWLISPLVIPVAAPILAAASFSAQATQYATFEEAAKRSFTDATSFSESITQLSDAEKRSVSEQAGVPARGGAWRIISARVGDKTLGVMVLDSVIGKFELIDYAVAIGADGKIINIEILNYRESHGYEVRLPAWRKQFAGKNVDAKLRVSEDIANISGATMSTTNVTNGVRRAVILVAALKAGGRL